MSFWRSFRAALKQSDLERVRHEDLIEARARLHEYECQAEYCAANARMLRERIVRLQREIDGADGVGHERSEHEWRGPVSDHTTGASA